MDFGVVLGTWNQVWQFGSVGLGLPIPNTASTLPTSSTRSATTIILPLPSKSVPLQTASSPPLPKAELVGAVPYLYPPSPCRRRLRPHHHCQRPNSLKPSHSHKSVRPVEEAEVEAPQEGQELLHQQMYEEGHAGDSEKVTDGAEEIARS
ncbi:hypothetical protein JHK82_033740 [Glycine max]|nr:hypothetical protein JHK85_034456 [Glycine max]KAG5119320.1 hypothetical protein JHK82_033740 [Glycine max]KAG5140314.1 hypothetical protein JHK84_034082 [Glycine max]